MGRMGPIKGLVSDLVVVAAWMCAWVAAGATNTAGGVSYGAVSNAVFLAASGDTVVVPAGAAGWSNTLVIDKPLHLLGGGKTATFITNWCDSWAPLITVRMTAGNTFSVVGFYFDCNWDKGGGGISAATRGYQDAWKNYQYLTGVRIGQCVFDRCYYSAPNGSAPLEFWGRVWGVVDHCDFVDGVYAARFYGNPASDAQAAAYGWPADCSGTADWTNHPAPMYYLGTTNNMVIEDCTIKTLRPALSPPPGGGRVAVSSAWSTHYVFRYNLITNGLYSGQNDVLDLHGNKAVDGTYRGGVCVEVYGNRTYATDEAYRFAYLRGGTCLVFSNQFFGPVACGSVQLDEEEAWNGVGPTDVTWPGMDCVTNSFFWANTVYGTNYAYPVQVNELTAAAGSYFQEGRDYWTHAPNGTNALAAYAPLVYPHPLVSGFSGGGGTGGTGATHGIVSGRGVWGGRGIF